MPITFPPPPTAGATPDPLVPPGGPSTGSIGTAGNRWASLHVEEPEFGDLILTREVDGELVRWRGKEHSWGIEWMDETSGIRYAQRLVDLPQFSGADP